MSGMDSIYKHFFGPGEIGCAFHRAGSWNSSGMINLNPLIFFMGWILSKKTVSTPVKQKERFNGAGKIYRIFRIQINNPDISP